MEVSQDFPDRSYAFKGKRSKRSRPSSPFDIAGTMVTSSSSVAGGSDDGGGGGDVYYSSAIIQYSPTTSTTQISTSSTSEEDEDMANCLILLAQSGRKVQVVTEVKKEKISSRKFTEMVNTTTGKAGFFVYECKTCNRTFPSFQALGGHRASHRRPKTIVEEKKSVTITATATATAMASASTAMATASAGADSLVENHDDNHVKNDQEEGRLNKISASLSIQIVNNNKGINSHGNSYSKPKIHECSICGSEFSSGQALGGHMRKHKPPTTTTATNSTKVSTNTHIETINNFSESSHDDVATNNYKEEEKSTRNFLSLDLNLPAPPEDDRRETKFEQSLVFSAAPLVGCHY
ncbi:PREDICTED: zinc finger protein ZAT5 [Nicotiana attenuata]|uniref:Zinc finger protein zat5 n=1 Tax=Nicotiana attenuata TaxID=49451 RepID=A0A314LFH2_NICAT|nr:PREDICTED: zinc finger protein ZAT5 [Nicotiana attenuata]OIT40303.1 zinc finger protein zat5 [Nicotiana attenuata]